VAVLTAQGDQSTLRCFFLVHSLAMKTFAGHSLDRSRIEQAPSEQIQLSPAPWPHWTIKGTE